MAHQYQINWTNADGSAGSKCVASYYAVSMTLTVLQRCGAVDVTYLRID